MCSFLFKVKKSEKMITCNNLLGSKNTLFQCTIIEQNRTKLNIIEKKQQILNKPEDNMNEKKHDIHKKENKLVGGLNSIGQTPGPNKALVNTLYNSFFIFFLHI